MILSNTDIRELANDPNQTSLVRYLATRINNMHLTIGALNERCDRLAGTLTHIGCYSAKRIHEDNERANATIANGQPDE